MDAAAAAGAAPAAAGAAAGAGAGAAEEEEEEEEAAAVGGISSIYKEPKGWRIFFLGSRMGIPSYFRKIVTSYTHIVRPVLPFNANTLCFDFNCLIYRCLQSPTLRPFPGYTDPRDAEVWESELLNQVIDTVKGVWRSAGSPPNVYIAVDGVVPMAKIRQQRVRRFKSAWISQQEGVSWDKNAITPGTLFMDKLTSALEALVKKHGSKWILSSVNEPGEGEHKLLSFLRKTPSLWNSPIVVYGLDADLILLSMIVSEEMGQNVWLMRERQEFESHAESEGYSFLDIGSLKEKVNVTNSQTCINYVTLMSLMGNDFLPHSLTHKLSDDGHACIMRELTTMTETEAWLVNANDTLNLPVLKGIASRWASEETERMYRMIEKKQKQAHRGVLQGMNPREGLPLTWNVEKDLLQGKRLRDGWREAYWAWMHEHVNREQVCAEYVRGVQWILAYYRGKPIDTEWMYPYWIPPLWSDIARISSLPFDGLKSSVPPSPQEQLSMVLPLQSWGLVRDPKLKTLPLLCPQVWPASFSFFSAGRKWLWECEARIPILTAGRIRDLLTETK